MGVVGAGYYAGLFLIWHIPTLCVTFGLVNTIVVMNFVTAGLEQEEQKNRALLHKYKVFF